MSIGAQIILLGFLVFSSAFFSSAETAITSLDEGRLRYLINAYSKKKKGLTSLLEHANDQITALLLMNNLVNIGASSLMTLLCLQVLPEGLPSYQAGLIATGIMTVSLLILAEITPKNFAKNNTERYTLAIINSVYRLTRFLRPFIIVFRGISRGILRLFGEKLVQEEILEVSDEQIEVLIDAGERRGMIDSEDGEMIRRILSFDDMLAKQVMISRTDVQLFEVNTSPSEARERAVKDGHSRFPVYEGVPDNIVGTLYTKDLLRQDGDSYKTIRELLRPAYYTPTAKPINDLLREFQQEKVHLAVVIDEFGGMAGIVTLEDILEQIVGEIEDEYDKPITLIKRVSPDEAIVEGDMSIPHLNRTMMIELPEGEAVTVSGLIQHRLEAMPEAGEEVAIGFVELTVEAATEREITSVRVKVNRSNENEDTSTLTST